MEAAAGGTTCGRLYRQWRVAGESRPIVCSSYIRLSNEFSGESFKCLSISSKVIFLDYLFVYEWPITGALTHTAACVGVERLAWRRLALSALLSLFH